MSEDFSKGDLINMRERHSVNKRQPAIDKTISEIVGKEVKTTDPRLIGLITKWKKAEAKADDSEINSNYLDDPKKVEELKKAFI